MAPLDSIRLAADALRASELVRAEAREELRSAILEAREDEVPIAVIARAAQLTIKQVTLLAQRPPG